MNPLKPNNTPNPEASGETPLAVETYRVPKRFGVSGIMAITTLMAILFGLLRNFPIDTLDAYSGREEAVTSGWVYLFLGTLILSTCLVQMRYGDVPRAASGAIGAVLLTLCMILWAFTSGERGFIFFSLLFSPFIAAFGALLGYCAGTCTAGCFLLMDQFESWLSGKPRQTVDAVRRIRTEPIMVDRPTSDWQQQLWSLHLVQIKWLRIILLEAGMLLFAWGGSAVVRNSFNGYPLANWSGSWSDLLYLDIMLAEMLCAVTLTPLLAVWYWIRYPRLAFLISACVHAFLLSGHLSFTLYFVLSNLNYWGGSSTVDYFFAFVFHALLGVVVGYLTTVGVACCFHATGLQSKVDRWLNRQGGASHRE